jgi:hypothetical protein
MPNFFRRKLPKIAENCDHNIGPLVQIQSCQNHSSAVIGGIAKLSRVKMLNLLFKIKQLFIIEKGVLSRSRGLPQYVTN